MLSSAPPLIGNSPLDSPISAGRCFRNWYQQRSPVWTRDKTVKLLKSFLTQADAGGTLCFDTNFIFLEVNDADGVSYVFYDGQQRLTALTLITLALLRLYRESTESTRNATSELTKASAAVLAKLHSSASISGDQESGEIGSGGAFSHIGEDHKLETYLSIKRGSNEQHLDDLLNRLAFMPETELNDLTKLSRNEATRVPESRIANNFLGLLEYLRSLKLDDERFAKLVNSLTEFKCYYSIYKDDERATLAYVNANNGTQMSFAGLMRVGFAGLYSNDENAGLLEALNATEPMAAVFMPKAIFSARDELNGTDLIYRIMLSSCSSAPIPAGDATALNAAEVKAALPTAEAARLFTLEVNEVLALLVEGGKHSSKAKHRRTKLYAQFIHILATQGNDTSSYFACFYLLRVLMSSSLKTVREVLDAFTRLYINVTYFGAENAPREAGNTFYSMVCTAVETIGASRLSRGTLDEYFENLTGPWAPHSKGELSSFLLQERFEPKSADVFAQLYTSAAAYSDTVRAIRADSKLPGVLYNYGNLSFTQPHKSGIITVVGANQAHADLITGLASDGRVYPGTFVLGHAGVKTGENGTQMLSDILERMCKPASIHISGTSYFEELASRLEGLIEAGHIKRGELAPEWVAENKQWQAKKLANAYGFKGVTLEPLHHALRQRFGVTGTAYLVMDEEVVTLDLATGELHSVTSAVRLESWTAVLENCNLSKLSDFVDEATVFFENTDDVHTLKELLAS